MGRSTTDSRRPARQGGGRGAAQAPPRMHPGFASAVSHELRAPLNVIIGYGDLLREEALGAISAEQRDALQRIADNAGLLLDRLDSVLDFSRIQSGVFEHGIQDVSVDEVLASLAGDARLAAARKDATVRFEVEHQPGLPFVATDPEKLGTILRHVVRNALKFTDVGAVRVAAHETDAGIEFVVHDTGPGIPDDHLDRIFEPFSKVNEQGEKGFRDLGLGLYIARGYVASLGGRITAESAPGRGSTFRIWLPLSRATG